jgi:hypothetical protein
MKENRASFPETKRMYVVGRDVTARAAANCDRIPRDETTAGRAPERYARTKSI